MDVVLYRLSAAFRQGLDAHLAGRPGITCTHLDAFDPVSLGRAEVLVTLAWPGGLVAPAGLRLVQVPAAGLDMLDMGRVPRHVPVANAYGHERSMAEYVLAAILHHAVGLGPADVALRTGRPAVGAGSAAFRGSAIGKTLLLLGHGHVGEAVAALATAHGLRVTVANRTHPMRLVEGGRWIPLSDAPDELPSADYIVCALPLTAETRSLIGQAAFEAMRPDAVLVNVGRGEVVDERALFEALSRRRIALAVIDTWYSDPRDPTGHAGRSRFDFCALSNVLMTPHMSAWTGETLERRRAEVAENILRTLDDRPPINVVRRA